MLAVVGRPTSVRCVTSALKLSRCYAGQSNPAILSLARSSARVGKALASPPSEPYGRFSRIRLYIRQFPHRGCPAASRAGKSANSPAPAKKALFHRLWWLRHRPMPGRFSRFLSIALNRRRINPSNIHAISLQSLAGPCPSQSSIFRVMREHTDQNHNGPAIHAIRALIVKLGQVFAFHNCLITV